MGVTASVRTTVRALILLISALALLALGLAGLVVPRAGAAEPTIVKEIISLRSSHSTTYELSDGSMRTTFSVTPIRFRDASGSWQTIDTRLLADPADGAYVSTATPARVEISSQRPEVALAAEGHEIAFWPLWSVSADALILGDTAAYGAVAKDTELRYQVLPEGVKEELLLSSAGAPRRFSFRLSHAGLSLRYGADEGWGLYQKDATKPLFSLGELTVFDSSQSEAGEPAYCAEASMSVLAGEQESTLTYEIPEAWLAASERVFPVHVDPSITFDEGECTDTYISSAYPDSSYGGSEELKVGRYDASTGHNRALIKFDMSSIAGHYAPTACMHMYQHHQYYVSQAMTTHIGLLRESWGQGTTWNILGDNGGQEFDWFKDVDVARGAWMEPTVRIPTQEWLEGTHVNYGFIVYQKTDGSEDATYWRKFRSREYGTDAYRPTLDVTHETPATASTADASLYRIGDTVTATVTVSGTAYTNQIRQVRLGVNRTDADSARYRGVLGWFGVDPSGVDANWKPIEGAPAGFYYYDSASYGTDKIEPLAGCSKDSATQYTFRFRLRQSFGEIQDNDLDTRLLMDTLAAAEPIWDSGWVNQNTNFDILPNDPFHTSADLGSWDGHDASAELDTGSLSLSTTDLAIASWGPAAALSRNYNSSRTSAGAFGTGWRFCFERSLSIGSSLTTYTDEAGDQHRFTKIGSTWYAPTGCFSDLAPDGSNWKITETDGKVLVFDSAGKLLSEADANGNATTYAWSGANLTSITAANGQSISVTMNSGVISAASYATTAGTRAVTYANGTTPTVTYFPGHSVERTVSYTYSSSRLSAITQVNWPASGQSVSQAFLYTSGALTEVRFADYAANADAKAQISYGTRTATLTRYGTVGGQSGQACGHQTYTWNATGTIASLEKTDSPTSTTTYLYGEDLQLISETTRSAGGTLLAKTAYEYNQAGDCTSEQITRSADGSQVAETSYGYDSAHRLTSETSPAGAQTTYSYQGANLVRVQSQLNATQSALTLYEYDGYGRATAEDRLISGTINGDGSVTNGVWAQTEYADYAANGEAGTTRSLGVKLSSQADPVTLETHRSYDAFGNLISETEQHPSSEQSPVTVVTNSYDPVGRLIVSHGPSLPEVGTTTIHTVYDRLGYQRESYATCSSIANVKADWEQTTVDALGRVASEQRRLSSASEPTGPIESETTMTYDGRGLLLTSDSGVDGEPARNDYDARGNLIEEWREGLSAYADIDAVRTTYDALDRPTEVREAGESQPTVTIYACDGQVTLEQRPDMSSLAYTYDGAGRMIERGVSDGDGSYEDDYELDLGGRVTQYTDGQTQESTTYTYDLLGQVITTTPAGEATLDTTYNTLGQELEAPDEEGETIASSYSARGQLTGETSSEGTLAIGYDDLGRTDTRSEPTGATTDYDYDGFGREAEVAVSEGSQTLSDESTEYDSLGLRSGSTDEISGRTDSWSEDAYGVGTHTIDYGSELEPAMSTVITSDADGVLEAQRTTTLTFSDQTQVLISRTIQEIDSEGSAISATLDLPGAQPDLDVQRSFDSTSLLTKQWGDGLPESEPTSPAYSYSGGQKIADDLPLDPVGGSGGYEEIAADYAYRSGSDALDSWESSSPGADASMDYQYDANDNLVAIVDDRNTSETSDDLTRTFDETTGALLSEQEGSTVTTEYVWDAQTGELEQAGPPSDPDQIDYQYNSSGQLVAIVNAVAGEPDIAYSYNDAGELTSSVIVEGSLTTTTDYVYDDGHLLQLSTSRSDGQAWTVTHIYDEEAKPYAAVYRKGSETPITFSTVVNDQGDVVELIDKNGDAFAAYRYDPWGAPQGGEVEDGKPTGVQTNGTTAIAAATAEQIADRQLLRASGLAYEAESGLSHTGGAHYFAAAGRMSSGAEASELRGACPTETLKTTDADLIYRHGLEHVTRVCWPADNVVRAFRNYDGYSPYTSNKRPTLFRFDHPLSLVVKCRENFYASDIEHLLREHLHYKSWYADLAVSVAGPTWGRLRTWNQNDSASWSYTTSTMKKRLAADKDSFFHVRFYGKRGRTPTLAVQTSTARGFVYKTADGTNVYYMVGTCHVDVNELGAGPHPGSAFPKPPIIAEGGRLRWKWSGNSERVESDIAMEWKTYFSGIDVLSSENGPSMENRDDIFCYKRERRFSKTSGVYYVITGKWWRSSGSATVLNLPTTRYN